MNTPILRLFSILFLILGLQSRFFPWAPVFGFCFGDGFLFADGFRETITDAEKANA